MQLDGGRLAAKVFAREGVDTIFTLCGGHVMLLYDGCLDHGIRTVDVRHEQAAAHAAEAYTRITGKTGVAIVTAGPGVTDAFTGLVNAYNAEVPMLLVGGQASVEKRGMGALQETDHLAFMRPFTKFAASVPETKRIGEYVGEAIRAAWSGRPGPSFLELPYDVLTGVVDEERATPAGNLRPPDAAPSAASVEQAVEALANAERPVLMAGSAVGLFRAHRELDGLARALHCPVLVNGMARGALPAGHPLLFGLARKKALREADAIAFLYTPLDFRVGYGQPPGVNAEAKIVVADTDGVRIGWNRAADVGLVGHARLALDALARVATGVRPNPAREDWLATLRAEETRQRDKLSEPMASQQTPIHAMRFAAEVAKSVTKDTILIADGGNVVGQASKVLPVHGVMQWLDPGRFGCLGVGLPYAVAAKGARPDARVLVVMGDGTFGLNGFEFDTLVRHKLPVVAVVGNDGGWGQIRGPQVALFGEERAVGTALAETKYDKVVEALGGHGEHVTDPAQIGPALERAFASGKPACVNVRIDPLTNWMMSAGVEDL